MLIQVRLLIGTESDGAFLLVIRAIAVYQLIAILTNNTIVLLSATFCFCTNGIKVITTPGQNSTTHHTHMIITPSVLRYFR